MKVERITPKPAFVPVVITLETQEEVDQLYSLVNHASVVPDGSPLSDASVHLEKFATHSGFEELDARLKIEFGNK